MALSAVDYMQTHLAGALAGDQDRCLKNAEAALAEGLPLKRLYLDVFQAAQREVGELWAANAISVGAEHRATAVTQAVIASLYEHIVNPDGHGASIVLGCVGRERHEVGPRMVADFAEMAGYDVSYLGTIAGERNLVAAVETHRPMAVGLSATLPTHLPDVLRYIQALRDALGAQCPQVFVGGRAFMLDDEAWRRVGADWCASDAEEAIRRLDESHRRGG